MSIKLSIEEIEEFAQKVINKQAYNSRWIFQNEKERTTDVGYAIEGIECFIEDLKILTKDNIE